ncbi:MAG: DUF4234 domain-containing protein [Candidatus Dormibacteraeota bacterium]|nr:DUF4234 domain-containing protein [Candidatus Dormibacteraeota bacterium]
MSQLTSPPAPSSAAVLDPEAAEPPLKRIASIPEPVLPASEPEVAVNGTKVPTTPPAPPAAGSDRQRYTPPAPPQRLAARSLGPAGRRRSPLGVALLSIVTLGAYALFWHQRTNRELRDFDPRMHVRPGHSTLAVAIPWALGVLVTLAAGLRIALAVAGVALPFDPHVTVLQAYGLLGSLLLVPYAVIVLPFSAVAMVMTLERARMAEDRVGITTDVQLRPVSLLCVMLVPVIGGLIVQAVVQRRLNRVWQTAPATEARITRH